MASPVDICNMALSELGITQFISSIDPSDGSTQADVCAIHYPAARDHFLREFPFRWSTSRALLALIGSDLVTNWAYVYAYPSDCLRILELTTTAARNPILSQSVQYEIGNYLGSRVIFTDMESAEAIYTVRITDTTMLDPMCVTALANLIGSRCAMPLAHGELANNLLQAYYALAAQAWEVDRNEGNPGPSPVGETEAFRS